MMSTRMAAQVRRVMAQEGQRVAAGALLISLGDELSRSFRNRFVGTVRPVLWENERQSTDGPRWFGHTDNYIAAYTVGEALHNRIMPMRVRAVYDDGVSGIHQLVQLVVQC